MSMQISNVSWGRVCCPQVGARQCKVSLQRRSKSHCWYGPLRDNLGHTSFRKEYFFLLNMLSRALPASFLCFVPLFPFSWLFLPFFVLLIFPLRHSWGRQCGRITVCGALPDNPRQTGEPCNSKYSSTFQNRVRGILCLCCSINQIVSAIGCTRALELYQFWSWSLRTWQCRVRRCATSCLCIHA